MWTPWRGIALFCVIAAVTITSAALAERVSVRTVDGRQIEGQLVREDPDTVTLEIAGVKTPIARTQIARITVLPSIAEQYRRRRAKLKDSDLNGRYQLAYFLYEHDADTLALVELDALHHRFPKSDKVTTLRRIVLAHRKALAVASPAYKKPAHHWPVPLNKRLTMSQINRIKVYETDLSEHPQVLITPPTIDRFLRQYATASGMPDTRQARVDFRHALGYKQLELFFKVRARDFYGDVRVSGDPPALRSFRNHIQQNYLFNYCATTRCHGGGKPVGGLYLFRAQPDSQRTAYTNFYILNHYANDQGKMIDRKSPYRSLLIQYGLPANEARTPHPKVPGWHPYFHLVTSARFRSYINFIKQLYKPAPNYGIDYQPPQPQAVKPPTPTSASATRPATTRPVTTRP